MLNYLVYARYLSFNPLGLMRYRNNRSQGAESQRNKVLARILEVDEWEAMLETLYAMPETSKNDCLEKERLIFLVAILFLLGLRINELATHSWGAFQKVQDKWWFFVTGKGDKEGKIPVNEELLQAMRRYREYCGFTALPIPDDNTPIMQSQRTGKPITARHMNRLLKELALQTAEKFVGQPHKVAKLKNFSPHWLRHLSATMQDRAGVQFKHIRANHRHANEETTRQYVHAFDDERHHDMQKLSLLREQKYE